MSSGTRVRGVIGLASLGMSEVALLAVRLAFGIGTLGLSEFVIRSYRRARRG